MKEYVRRTYRSEHAGDGLVYFQVRRDQSDLFIGAVKMLKGPALQALDAARREVVDAIRAREVFATALVPLPVRPEAAPLERLMCEASATVGVGPMAAVAGAIAQQVGKKLLPQSPEIVVENGGDIYMNTQSVRHAAVWAGDSPLSGKLALVIPPGEWGVCTSAGVVGPSLSMGRAHAAVILSHDTALADAAATALGNRVRDTRDLEASVKWAMRVPGVEGALVILGEAMAAAGAVELAPYIHEQE